jgi:2,3-bisphosphoglycerate-independent phosphoglycerate mutase
MLTKAITRGGTALAKTVQELYQAGQTDYYIEPIVLTGADGQSIGRIRDGDAAIFCCRRGEREIQLTEAFTDPAFDRFPRPDFQNIPFVILTRYHEKFKDLPVAFASTKVEDTLGETVSRAGMRQLHVAESEKFAHITFFLNGGESWPFDSEDDICISSPRGVPFDRVPELSLAQVCEEVKHGIQKHYDLIVTNFANGDVIGHTANCEAKIQCAEIVDDHLGLVVDAAVAGNYVVMVTADHGNLEVMTNPDGTPHVSHTSNKVPFILIDPASTFTSHLRDGKLADLAPTVLSALGLKRPPVMDGGSLAPDYNWTGKRRVLLVILDGWGFGPEDDSNPIFSANTPVWDEYLRRYPNARLEASGQAVGLQKKKAGNSEAGHMNIGAGRVVPQDDVRLDMAMKDGSFYTNETFVHVIEDIKQRGTSLHLIALLSEKSSHGSIAYPLALLCMAKERDLEQVYVHVIFDGRSTEPGSAPDLLKKFEGLIDEIGVGQIVTGIGRGIALDRVGNYAKTRRAFDALVLGTGIKAILE